jgi:hypothetical protein
MYPNNVASDQDNLHDVFYQTAPGGPLARIVPPFVPAVSAAGDGDSILPALDYDGSHVAFETQATNLPSATGVLFDLQHARYGDLLGNYPPLTSGSANAVRFSGDGRYLARPGARVDLVTHDYTTVDVDGEQHYPGPTTLSFDGRYAAFRGLDVPLLPSPTAYQAYLVDLFGATVTKVSRAYGGGAPDGDVFDVTLSSDGRFVAFVSRSTNLLATPLPNGVSSGLYRYDRVSGETISVSVAPGGQPASGSFGLVAVSGDGNLVAFFSDNATLDPGATPPSGFTLYVRDIAAATTTAVRSAQNGLHYAAVAATGGFTFGAFYTQQAAMSDDGRYLAFWTSEALAAGDTNNAEDLYVFDRSTQQATRAGTGPAIGGAVSLSGDGHRLAVSAKSWTVPNLYGVDGPAEDVYVLDNPAMVIFESGFE